MAQASRVRARRSAAFGGSSRAATAWNSARCARSRSASRARRGIRPGRVASATPHCAPLRSRRQRVLERLEGPVARGDGRGHHEECEERGGALETGGHGVFTSGAADAVGS